MNNNKILIKNWKNKGHLYKYTKFIWIYDFMPRKKLIRYSENQEDSLILQPGKLEFESYKNNRSAFFGNDNPITLELACGKGEYTVGLAPIFSKRNFIGIDRKGNRLRFGAQEAKEKWLKNIWFIRTIIHHLDQFFAEKSVEEIWIIHPDPRPKWADERRRLTNPRFLTMYQKILQPGGLLRLKTDDADLFQYSVQMLNEQWRTIVAQTTDLYNSPLLDDHHGITTHYETLFHQRGRTINYLKALPPHIAF